MSKTGSSRAPGAVTSSSGNKSLVSGTPHMKPTFAPNGSSGNAGSGRAPVTPPAGSQKGGTSKLTRPANSGALKGGGKTVPHYISGKRDAIAPAKQPSAAPAGGVSGYGKGNIKDGSGYGNGGD